MIRRSLRLPVAIIAAIAVAELGAQLLRPRSVGPESLPVSAERYFTTEQIGRAKDFRDGQLILFGVSTAIEFGLLVLLIRRPPRHLVARFKTYPVLTGAAVGVGLSLAISASTIPIKLIARERAKDVGLVTQNIGGWAIDQVKGEGVGLLFAGLGGASLVFLMRRFGSRWWIPGTVVVIAFGAITTYIGPVVIEPIFNEFKVLPAGKMRTDVLDLAKKANVDVGEIYEVDASKRTTAANAYVTGFGKTKRVVLYDTLLKDFTPKEIRLVVAHELSHVRHDDVPMGLIYLTIIAPFAMFAIARLTETITRPKTLGTPLVIPAVVLSISVMGPVIGIIANQLSRAIERRADYFALQLTDDPKSLIGFEKRITVKNIIDPDPSPIQTAIFGTHPTALQRIGLAEAFQKE